MDKTIMYNLEFMLQQRLLYLLRHTYIEKYGWLSCDAIERVMYNASQFIHRAALATCYDYRSKMDKLSHNVMLLTVKDNTTLDTLGIVRYNTGNECVSYDVRDNILDL